MLQKTTLVLLGLAASSYAAAGTMGPVCTPGNVTVPCVERLWDLGIQALYLESVFDANKAYAQNAQLGQPNIDRNDWDWGFRLEGSYHFNTGNDVSVNWTHYKGGVNHFGGNGLVPLPPQSVTTVPYNLITIDRYDQANVIMGQHVDFGLVKKMRFYGGLQYANIQANSSNLYNFALAPTITSVSLFDNTEFRGIGPTVGLDYAYHLTDAFSVIANGAGSILYGTSRYNIGYVAAPSGLVLVSQYAKTGAMVPSLEAKLGLNYAYSMPEGVVNLEGGYQVVNYFNALEAQSMQSLTASIASVSYGLYGPYFGVKYVGLA
jgi:hypothetical protein